MASDIHLRFGNNRKKGCCILLGPELCQNPAFYKSEHGSYFCEGHRSNTCVKWLPAFQPGDSLVGLQDYKTCDKVLLRQFCENPATWQYIDCCDKTQQLCDYHAGQFKQIRPTFEDPLPKGYAARRLESKVKIHLVKNSRRILG